MTRRASRSSAEKTVNWVRLAVSQEDYENESILGFELKKNDKTRSVWKPYQDQFGDGCIEVDAIPANEIRRRLEDAIQTHIDQDEWALLQLIETEEKKDLFATIRGLGGHRMTGFDFHLPDWPPQRLVSEAVLSANLRHMDEPLLDPDTSPWPLVRGALLAFLRHRLSAYDERLRTRYEHDPKYHDELAAQVAAAAFRKYPWLRYDPRPFPEQEHDSPPQLFTGLARDLAHDHGLRDHLNSAIRDLRREGNKQEQIITLQAALVGVEQRIKRSYEVLTGPKYSHDAHGSQSRGWSFPHLPEEMGHYYFIDDRVVIPNGYDYQGFRCPQCQSPVVRLKQPVNFGQSWRMIVYSCFCHTLAIACPPAGRRLKPLTLERWNFSDPSNAS